MEKFVEELFALMVYTQYTSQTPINKQTKTQENQTEPRKSSDVFRNRDPESFGHVRNNHTSTTSVCPVFLIFPAQLQSFQIQQ